MTLHQLKVFLTIVKLNGVAQAAKALHISQPSVSGVVQNLQDELGVKLFERLGNRRKLTEAGKRVLQRAETVLANTEAIKEDLDELKGLKKGRISIGGCSLAAASGLPWAVQTFKKEYPGVEIGLTIDQSSSLEKALLEGEMDVAVLSWPSRSNLLITELWREEEIVVVALPEHPLAKRRAVSLSLLAKEPLIVNLESRFVREMVEDKFAEQGIVFQPGVEVKTYSRPRDAIKNSILSNLGIGFLAKSHIVGDLKSGTLKTLRVPALKLKRPMYITVHKNRKDRPLTQTFTKLLKDLKPEQ
jgi:DNA-binding transcriptional LysR family regulator